MEDVSDGAPSRSHEHSYSNSYYISYNCCMKTVQLTLDEPLVAEVDRVVKELGTSRSAFTRSALRAALEADARAPASSHVFREVAR